MLILLLFLVEESLKRITNEQHVVRALLYEKL